MRPGRDVVRAEVDERADRPVLADARGDRRLVDPFCSDTTNPSDASRGAIASSAAAVCCAFTASRTAFELSGSPSRHDGRRGTLNSSTGPSIASPRAFIAATCSASASQSRTPCPSRASRAPIVPPIAPAPTTTYFMRRLYGVAAWIGSTRERCRRARGDAVAHNDGRIVATSERTITTSPTRCPETGSGRAP